MSLKDTATRVAVLDALAKTIDAELKTAKRDLEAGLKAAKADTGTQKISISLTEGQDIGSVSLVQPKPAAAITDSDKFLAWVREVRPAEIVSRLVTEIRPAWQAVVLKEISAAGVAEWADPETGVIHTVPGVELQGRAAYTRLTVPDAGSDAIAEAWRAGTLAMPGGTRPPAVESGEADQLRARVAELEKRDAWLSALEAAGVDNWQGMDRARELYNGGEA